MKSKEKEKTKHQGGHRMTEVEKELGVLIEITLELEHEMNKLIVNN